MHLIKVDFYHKKRYNKNDICIFTSIKQKKMKVRRENPMKRMRKVLALILTVCFILPCFPITSFAASGIIFFTDLETAVGETFTVTGTVVTKNDVLGKATVQMSYDTGYLRFVEGNGVTQDSEGQLTYTGSGDGSSDRVEFTMQFQALAQGTTRIEQGTATVTNRQNAAVTCEAGYADITIAEGDPSKIESTGTSSSDGIEIGGTAYTISTSFSESSVPAGFMASEVTYKDAVYHGIIQQNGTVQGLYLTSSEGKSAFFLYNATKDSFYPCEEIMISEDKSIVMLADTAGITLKKRYDEASMSINGTEFPVWLVRDRDNFYVVYASDNEGKSGFYLYDAQENTYQRAYDVEAQEEVTTEQKTESTLTKISNFVYDNFIWVFVGVVCGLVILLIILITLAVKLRHRNLELDDLYDEYGIDLDEMPEKTVKKSSGKKSSKKKPQPADDDYLDYEDDYDDLSDDYYDESEEDDLADLRESFQKSKQNTQNNYDDYYDDDDYEDDEEYEDEYEYDPDDDELKRSVNSDTFEMDFIDFD